MTRFMTKTAGGLSVLMALGMMAAPALAQGPVATACADEIAKHCAGLEHGQGAVRQCLEANKDKVSEACRTALDTTGPGKGMGGGMGGQGPKKPN